MAVKKIIVAPHPALRQTAQAIASVTPAVKQYVQALQDTIQAQQEPAAAGLALPQIDTQYRAFATYLDTFASEEPQVRIFINPVLIDKSDKLTTGPDPRHPDLEGCLSIPALYGPVARPEWVVFEYQELLGDELSDTQRETFYDFAGRVMQHELDHLNGILFTDYTLSQGQPLYRSEKKQLVAIDPIVAEAFS